MQTNYSSATLPQLQFRQCHAQNHKPPADQHLLCCRANIKVSSTETGAIFGNIVYETARAERDVVVLNDIHIDIMDYINPASCVDVQFRSMWAEFEWENKVSDAILRHHTGLKLHSAAHRPVQCIPHGTHHPTPAHKLKLCPCRARRTQSLCLLCPHRHS